MAYLVVADVADHTVRDPVGFTSLEAAEVYLSDLGKAAVSDGLTVEFRGPHELVVATPGLTEEFEIYRVVESSDKKVLRMTHAAPPSEYVRPVLP